jgi:hypothetical protein
MINRFKKQQKKKQLLYAGEGPAIAYASSSHQRRALGPSGSLIN